jgi:hypothetical protein
MGKNQMIRFDDLTRVEEYYSATILPYLFAYNNFSGLAAFEQELLSQNLISTLSSINNDIQIITEIYVERDLPYYKIEIPSSAFEKKLGVQSKPDILILTNESIYIFECKVFMKESEYSLHKQILRQKYIFDIIEKTTQHSFKNKLHILLIPYEYDIADCVVFTLVKLYDIIEKVVPKNNYFLQRLKGALNRL